jgi:hypothetical protein
MDRTESRELMSTMELLSGVVIELRRFAGLDERRQLRAEDVKHECGEELLRVRANGRPLFDRGLVALVGVAVDDPEDVRVVVAERLAGEDMCGDLGRKATPSLPSPRRRRPGSSRPERTGRS